MGFLSGLKDSLFGDEGEKASRKQSEENEQNRAFIREGIAAATADINRIFPQAQAARLFGAQGAQNVMQGFVPQQLQAFQQGNLQAQTTQSLAPQQIQNALLGLPTDFSFLQPQQGFQPNFDFLNQPLQPPVQEPLQQPPVPQQQANPFGGAGNGAGQNPFNNPQFRGFGGLV